MKISAENKSRNGNRVILVRLVLLTGYFLMKVNK